ncbi:hypothetical protein KTH06_14350 [Acinetobacter ursingii]|uniref:hypothetical protein n=1 Tax=Acinetobacter ursingii TaxID=108980 RepID=UPI000F79722A|nr:hypothetical protein [Acinetobacter ursingii]MCU4306995.1 hypothetical protein [Acinetobacter ursingii]MCU4373250.1 hypothetical protein [Acinetobacter ursingii]RSO78067.1 hypothetical protein EA748_17635 [Acinetobacter ursingii]
MSKFKIAHLREQGQDMIIIPLDAQFHYKSESEQSDIIDELQLCASSAGLAGIVVVVWRLGNRVHFIAPEPWHPFFRSLSWNTIMANLNKELTCD